MEDLLKQHLFVVILCGGEGKRLWPRSRLRTPKQFLKLFGNKTIFQETVHRAKVLVPPSRIFVVTNGDYIDEVSKQAPEIPDKNILGEPLAKNTSLAMGMGTLFIHNIDPLAVIVNFTSDHHISDLRKFNHAVKVAAQTANLGDYLVTIGIRPTFAHTGMGYIKADGIFKKVDGVSIFKVEKFVEKPDAVTAQKFLDDGGYYWNANLYTWRADSILRSFNKYLQKLAVGLEKIRVNIGTHEEKKVIEKVYEEAESISIDNGISEKAENMLLVPATFSWSDVGDWKVAYDISKKDKNGNVLLFEKGKGGFMGIDTKNCLIHSSDQLIAAVGIKDLIIVDTKDALLIVKKDKAQDVKKIVNELIEQKKVKYL